MITNNHSWSLGSCSNISFEPDLRLETPVRPLHPGDHPSFSAQSNRVHRQDKLRLPVADSASQHLSTFSPSLPSRRSVNSSSFTNHEISRRNYLISRVCTTFAVNQIFFSASLSSRFPLFPPVQIQTAYAPLKPAKNHINHIKPDKNHLAFPTSYSAPGTNQINRLFRKKTDCTSIRRGARTILHTSRSSCFWIGPDLVCAMFDSLSGKLQRVFKDLRGLGKISEENIGAALRDVRLALLDADVNFKVARDFIERIKEKSLGQEVLLSIQPGQQVIKIIHDELVDLLGSENAGLEISGNPSSIMMVGLHGSGKTTSSAKLARLLVKQARLPLLVGADVYRPAAMDQLETLGKQLNIPVFVRKGETDVLKIAREAFQFAEKENRNTLIFDTAGRLQIDEPLIQELVRLRDAVKPQEVLLVLDAATGQEAVNVATHFNNALNVTGAILTKLDGDARGGAALSMKAVTGKPIKFAGIGEKLEDFEAFHPERMATRILGMGDVVSLVEKAAEAVDLEDAKRMEEKMRKGQFTLGDFLDQLRQMKKLGSLESVVGMLPGGSEMLKNADMSKSEKEFRRMEGIICSMTTKERNTPQLLNAKRRQRIAKGSGTSVAEVNNLLNRFSQMQQMMKKMGKFQKMMTKMGGGMGLPGLPGMGMK